MDIESQREPLPDSPDAFLSWAEGQEEKHEYVEGVVVMQAGASRDHEQVAERIFASLLRQVDDGEFDVNKGGFAALHRPSGDLPPAGCADPLRRGGSGATPAMALFCEASWIERSRRSRACAVNHSLRNPTSQKQ